MESSYNTERKWYTIRITRNRTASVYRAIQDLISSEQNHDNWSDFEIFAPCRNKPVFTYENQSVSRNEELTTIDLKSPILPGFLFVKTTAIEFKRLLDCEIPGLTPYYDHFKKLSGGNNPYLTIPDDQMENFRLYCEVPDEDHKLLDQKDVPTYLNGKKVRIISGPFKGIEGTVLRWHNMRRVFITLGTLGTFGTGFIRSCDFEVIL